MGLVGLHSAQHLQSPPQEADAYELLEELRWHGNPVCSHCGNDEKCYFLTPKNGETRATGPKRTMKPVGALEVRQVS